MTLQTSFPFSYFFDTDACLGIDLKKNGMFLNNYKILLLSTQKIPRKQN